MRRILISNLCRPCRPAVGVLIVSPHDNRRLRSQENIAMSSSQRLLVCCSIALITTPGTMLAQTSPKDEAVLIEFFEKKIRPLLVDNCYNCHSATTNSRGGLRVDDRNGLTVGGGRGRAVVPGHPEKSLMIQAVHRSHEKVQMPPNKTLSEQQVADLTQWNIDGAAWPKVRVPASIGRPNPKYEKLRKAHLAWQPLREPKEPAPEDPSGAAH